MDTKKAIEFLEGRNKYILYRSSANYIEKLNEAIDQVISSSQRGEKYEAMWKEMRKYLLNDLDDDYLESVEQKYSPKPKNRWHKINNVIYNLNTIGGKVDTKKLINLLIELRDEEKVK